MLHTVFFQFSCGHEFFDERVSGGVSDWDNCLCESCQPYDAVMVVNHPCRLCGGSFQYFRDCPQIRISEQEATCKKQSAIPLYGKK